MHWTKLVEAAGLFRELEPRACLYYDDYMKARNAALWASPDRLTVHEARLLIDFINKWGTRTPLKARQIVEAYHVAFPTLRTLQGKRFEEVDLASPLGDDATVGDAIATVFDAVARCGSRNESTGASKILHTWQPELFVMWDTRIRGGYGSGPTGQEYAKTFLPRLRKEAEEAVATYRREHDCDAPTAVRNMLALASVATFPKLLDEYNYTKYRLCYTKYRLGVEALWERLP